MIKDGSRKSYRYESRSLLTLYLFFFGSFAGAQG